jgi:hypothetical protein
MNQIGVGKFKFLSASAAASLGVALLLLLCSCYPSSDFGSVQDYDVVLTQYDDGQDFTEYLTFFVEDSVFHYKDPDDPSPDDIPRDNDALILATVRANMTALGYEYKADADSLNPSDLYVVIGVTSSDWYSVWYPWYPGWGGWWGWWGWYPGPPQISYAYTTGTIFIDMWDIKNAEDDLAPIPWYARLNGIVNDTSSSRAQRIENAIDQAFAQSPYLGRP